jgi:hypothetical protein
MTPDPIPKRPGNVRRPGGSSHPHDPRHMGRPPRDDRKPAGDESVSHEQDDVPDINDRSKAPIPGLAKVKRPEPVD